MRRMIAAALFGAALLSAGAGSNDVKVATREWVERYVADAISGSVAQLQATASVVSTNGATVYEVGSGNNMMRLVIEDSTVRALRATNCTESAVSAGVTNGTTFVWNGAGAFVNPAGSVSCTPTNLVYSGVSSVRTNGLERFEGMFDAYGVMIQPHAGLSITNGMVEVAL